MCGYAFRFEKSSESTKVRRPYIKRKNRFGKKYYKCTTCHYWYWDWDLIKQHVEDHVKMSAKSSKDTEAKVDNRAYRRRQTHAGEKFYLCSTCDYWCCMTLDEIKEHVEDHVKMNTGNKYPNYKKQCV